MPPSKAIVLQREESMRVIVTSANLVPRQVSVMLHTIMAYLEFYASFHFALFPDFILRQNRFYKQSAHRTFLGSAQASVVGLSHRFHIPSDAGSQLKTLSLFIEKCRENMHETTEVILKRNTNILADANAVSVLVADLDKFSEEDSVQLGFLLREVAKWVSPLSDLEFFNFSGFIYPKEALEAAFGVTNTKVQLLLYVSKILNSVNEIRGPEFSQISGLIWDEHLPPLFSLLASLKRCLELWRLEEFPFLFKSNKLQRLVLKATEDGTDEVHIDGFSGGAKTFEICAKFCYGMVVSLGPHNVVAAKMCCRVP